MQKAHQIKYCNAQPFMTVLGKESCQQVKSELTDLELADLIIRICATFYFVPTSKIKEQGKPKGELKKVRQVATALVLKYTRLTLKKTGEIFNCDHSTVIFRRQTVYDLCDIDQAYRADYETLQTKIEKLIIPTK